jgi:hypothetical protein
MADVIDPLVLDLVEWVAKAPRTHHDVMETWRTSCPRLTVWEEAVDRGYVARAWVAGRGAMVTLTPQGAAFLSEKGRAP